VNDESINQRVIEWSDGVNIGKRSMVFLD